MMRPKPFKIYCPKCGFEKVIWFESDAIGGAEIAKIPQICPKCGNEELEQKAPPMRRQERKKISIR